MLNDCRHAFEGKTSRELIVGVSNLVCYSVDPFPSGCITDPWLRFTFYTDPHGPVIERFSLHFTSILPYARCFRSTLTALCNTTVQAHGLQGIEIGHIALPK